MSFNIPHPIYVLQTHIVYKSGRIRVNYIYNQVTRFYVILYIWIGLFHIKYLFYYEQSIIQFLSKDKIIGGGNEDGEGGARIENQFGRP